LASPRPYGNVGWLTYSYPQAQHPPHPLLTMAPFVQSLWCLQAPGFLAWRWVRRGVPGAVVAVLLVLAGGAGCDTSATTKSYNYNNPVDPTAPPTTIPAGTVVVSYVDVANKVVILVNRSTTTAYTLTSWTLSSSTTPATYTFGAVTLSAGSFLRIHTAAGTNTLVDLYGSNITWGTSDIATLKDNTTATVNTCTYAATAPGLCPF